ncbi:hypothetical protein KV112_21255 [Mycolicibacter sp. MYC123]|uniref:Uncharacterized protein n=2 Tax=Mycolicibacter TaxID=1073531 RepID=A0ABU5YQ85_9MYCO|nr:MULTISPECIES: hypothetical protein [unclassified Mycolicibacter]MEB3052232.1 hypothetical protein [Mycolicibacter sp. MYC123]MEB3063643.1 hypothetical protein [Mycolicibacter sp. MYC101]MEB3069513.1 hypothetical protein [Mycolicibacter sp. MYC017]
MKSPAIITAAALMVSAAIATVSDATAQPLSGIFTAKMIDGGDMYQRGSTTTFTMTPCGRDCTHLDTGKGTRSDLRLRGTAWSGPFGVSASTGAPCTAVLDGFSLVLTEHCPGLRDVVIRLAKLD